MEAFIAAVSKITDLGVVTLLVLKVTILEFHLHLAVFMEISYIVSWSITVLLFFLCVAYSM